MHDETGRMTPHDAARTLAGLERYEETLTARAFGITLMAFGLAGPGIALTYAYAQGWFVDDIAQPWWLSFLWAPWIAAALLLTGAVWRTQAISLPGAQEDRGARWYGLAFTALYLVLYFVGWTAMRTFGGEPDGPHLNGLVLGVFTLLLAAFFQFRYGTWHLTRPMFLAGVFVLIVAAAALGMGIDGVPATLLLAFSGMLAYVGVGAFVAQRG